MNLLHAYLSDKEKDTVNESTVAYLASLDHIAKIFPEVAQSIMAELEAQRSHLKLIASENYCSLATQLTMGNLLTDKYSEGYPHHRFYAGCENIDTIEDLAVNELKKIFKCDHAYVQPHSGADANLVAFWAILMKKVQMKELETYEGKTLDQLSDSEFEHIRQKLVNQKILGMGLNSGGHLTHGYRQNASAKMFQALSYEIDPKTQRLDYEEIAKIAKKEKPLILIAGYSAYPRLVNFAKMKEIAHEVGAVLMVDMAHFSGLVAGGVLKGEYNPIPYADIVTSTTHKTLRGPRGGMVLCTEEYKDVVNKGCPLVLGGPLPHVMAAKAVAFREASLPSFQEYAKQIVSNAKALAEHLMRKGMKLYTDGTDNHLLVADVQTSFGINGRQAEMALRDANLTVNRNAIPFDVNGPWYTSGIRIGTPALTTLGMKENEMQEVAEIICEVLSNTRPYTSPKTGKISKAKVSVDEVVLQQSKAKVKDLLQQYPLYPEITINAMETTQCL